MFCWNIMPLTILEVESIRYVTRCHKNSLSQIQFARMIRRRDLEIG